MITSPLTSTNPLYWFLLPVSLQIYPILPILPNTQLILHPRKTTLLLPAKHFQSVKPHSLPFLTRYALPELMLHAFTIPIQLLLWGHKHLLISISNSSCILAISSDMTEAEFQVIGLTQNPHSNTKY